MAQKYPKWPKNDAQIYALFSAIFLTEKAVPQTFSLLECMCTPSKHTIITHQDFKSFWIKALIYLILVLWTESCSHRWLIASLSSANFFCLLCYNYTAEHHAISPKSLAGAGVNDRCGQLLFTHAGCNYIFHACILHQKEKVLFMRLISTGNDIMWTFLYQTNLVERDLFLV